MLTVKSAFWSLISLVALMTFSATHCVVIQAADPPSEASESAASAKSSSPAQPKWRSLFDGKSLKGWGVTEFGGEGEVTVEENAIVLQQGSELTGITWKGDPLPNVNYELELEARRLDGSDFFCGIVFPVRDKFCSFVVGGWGGGVVGLSSVDGLYASENDTASFHTFKDDTWYKVRLRVGEKFVQAWIDNKQVVDLDLTNREVSLHPAMAVGKPLTVACFATVASVRNVKFRELTQAERTYVPAAKE